MRNKMILSSLFLLAILALSPTVFAQEKGRPDPTGQGRYMQFGKEVSYPKGHVAKQLPEGTECASVGELAGVPLMNSTGEGTAIKSKLTSKAEVAVTSDGRRFLCHCAGGYNELFGDDIRVEEQVQVISPKTAGNFQEQEQGQKTSVSNTNTIKIEPQQAPIAQAAPQIRCWPVTREKKKYQKCSDGTEELTDDGSLASAVAENTKDCSVPEVRGKELFNRCTGQKINTGITKTEKGIWLINEGAQWFCTLSGKCNLSKKPEQVAQRQPPPRRQPPVHQGPGVGTLPPTGGTTPPTGGGGLPINTGGGNQVPPPAPTSAPAPPGVYSTASNAASNVAATVNRATGSWTMGGNTWVH